MNRSIGADMFRAIALLSVLIYHFWTLIGQPSITFYPISMFVMLGGELGVTGFFILSGYGIYCSLNSTSKPYCEYLLKRFKRIAPSYYLCIAIILLLLNASYVNAEGLKNIIAHCFFIHNFNINFHGSINGVLWTMGIIVQFYIIAPLLFKAFKQNGIIAEFFCIIFTIIVKGLIYRYYLPLSGTDYGSSVYFVMGRQLFTALDNFSAGMFIAWLIHDKKIVMPEKFGSTLNWTTFTAAILLLYVICDYGMKNGIHTNNASGYVWHTFLAIAMGILLYAFCSFRPGGGNVFAKGLIWLSHYEYCIYLWHLIIYQNFINNNAIVQLAIEKSDQWWLLVPFLASAIIVGYLFAKFEASIWHINLPFGNKS